MQTKSCVQNLSFLRDTRTADVLDINPTVLLWANVIGNFLPRQESYQAPAAIAFPLPPFPSKLSLPLPLPLPLALLTPLLIPLKELAPKLPLFSRLIGAPVALLLPLATFEAVPPVRDDDLLFMLTADVFWFFVAGAA